MYRPDPALLQQPLSASEVDELLARRGQDFTKARNAEHLLQRVAVTMQFFNDRIAVLNRDVDNMRVQLGSQPGRASTLSPLAAAKFLSPQDRAQLFDSTAKAYITQLEQLSQELQQAQREMLKVTNTVRTVLISLEEDPLFTPEVRQRFVQALRALPPPEHVEKVSHAAATALRHADTAIDPLRPASRPPERPAPSFEHPTTSFEH